VVVAEAATVNKDIKVVEEVQEVLFLGRIFRFLLRHIRLLLVLLQPEVVLRKCEALMGTIQLSVIIQIMQK
jgi:hypothetical protein